MTETFYNTYDENGNFRRKIPSSKVKTELNKDEYLKGVSCIIVQNGNILFETRSNNQDGKNLIDFCSGHIDNDETPEIAMIRELKEELGIDEKISKRITKLKYYTVTIEKRQSQKNWHMTFYYLKIPSDFKTKIQESEVKKVFFLPFTQAFELIKNNKELQFPYDENMKQVLIRLQSTL